jgi:hypothetical protein
MLKVNIETNAWPMVNNAPHDFLCILLFKSLIKDESLFARLMTAVMS